MFNCPEVVPCYTYLTHYIWVHCTEYYFWLVCVPGWRGKIWWIHSFTVGSSVAAARSTDRLIEGASDTIFHTKYSIFTVILHVLVSMYARTSTANFSSRYARLLSEWNISFVTWMNPARTNQPKHRWVILLSDDILYLFGMIRVRYNRTIVIVWNTLWYIYETHI